MQTDNRLFDDLARLMSGAMGAAGSLRQEVEAAWRAWLERRLVELDLVTRDEFEAVREMAEKAREENVALGERLAALEERLAALEKRPASARRRPAASGAKSRRTGKTAGKATESSA